MSDWITKLQEDRISRKADEDIERQKYELAVAETPRLKELIERRFRKDVSTFVEKFGDALRGPATLPSARMDDDSLQVETNRMPLYGVRFWFGPARLNFARSYLGSMYDDVTVEYDLMEIRASFNVEPWFEYRGKKLLTPEEVSKELLSEIFKSVASRQ